MKRAFGRGQRGFTLIEILIVLAVLAILAAVVVPNVAGFVTQSKDRAWRADQRMLQAAVDAWRTDVSSRSGDQWPNIQNEIGTPNKGADEDFTDAGDTNSFIDVAALATGTYLRGADAVRSANTTHNSTATQSQSGSYSWYVDSSGVVRSWYKAGNADNVVDASEVDFQTGIYP